LITRKEYYAARNTSSRPTTSTSIPTGLIYIVDRYAGFDILEFKR
jgi:hypothetical protein